MKIMTNVQVTKKCSWSERMKSGIAILTVVTGLFSFAGCSGGSNGEASTSSTPSNQANLSGLALSAGTLNPAFGPNATTYNTMFIGDTNITVTPTAVDSRATITVNGTPVVSGQASPAILLPAGATTITIQVRASDGVTTKTYNVTARRLAQETYLKASNTQLNSDEFLGDHFNVVAISGDTLVVGAPQEDSDAEGINGDQANNNALDSGAVYVFVRNGSSWTQQAYLKAINTGAGDGFGSSVAISGDTLVVGAPSEDSNARGVNGDFFNDSSQDAGAVYVFVRTGGVWSFQAYLKASNTDVFDSFDHFGSSVAISDNTIAVGAQYESGGGVSGASGAVYVFTRIGSDWSQQMYLKASNAGGSSGRFDMSDSFGASIALWGDALAVGAPGEDSQAIGINGNQTDNSALDSGAVYVFARTGTIWSQQAYVKASNTDAEDAFGASVALSGDTLAVGAVGEASNSTDIDGNQLDNSAPASGAVYTFRQAGGVWSQEAYLKASNTNIRDEFGRVALAGDTLVVGAWKEDSASVGVNGNQSDETAVNSGAAYVFIRRNGTWAQQAYVKPHVPQFTTSASQLRFGSFGLSLGVSDDTIIIGAYRENSGATGIGGNPFNASALNAGAVYVFR